MRCLTQIDVSHVVRTSARAGAARVLVGVVASGATLVPALTAGAQCIHTPQTAHLAASDSFINDFFGNAVAVDGSTAVIGCHGDGTTGQEDSGSAYIFAPTNGTWFWMAKLTASDAAAGDAFGESVAISGDTVVIGARGDDNAGGTDAGAAYVFVRSGSVWTQQAKLLASDRAASDWFGSAVAILGDTIVVGSPLDDNAGGADAGAAYVFTRSGTAWTETAKLLASDGTTGKHFGSAAAITSSGVRLNAVLGAPQDSTAGLNAGAAYVFNFSTVVIGATWTQRAKLLASDGAASHYFGSAVGLSGATAIVGAHGVVVNGAVAGAAYVYTSSVNGNTWSQQAKLTALDAAAFDSFGWSVGVSGNSAVIGAYQDTNASGMQAGSAYLFTRSGAVWTQSAKLLALDGSAHDEFGVSAGIAVDTVVVGAHRDTPSSGFSQAGSAYIFRVLACPADLDCDGQVAPADVASFVGIWSASLQNGTLEGDFDGSGAVTPADVAAFVSAWFGGLASGC